jgi:hypothetical protein
MMISAYAYDPDGEAVFFTAAGAYNGGTFTATVLRTANGQCFNCPYRKPTETAVGTVTIAFTSPWTANMTFLGEQIPIKRFAPAEYVAQVPDVMFGEWATIDGNTTPPAFYTGERLQFNSVFNLSDGTRTISGHRTGSLLSVAMATWDADTKTIQILLDASTQHYEVWMLNYSGVSRLDGVSAIFTKGSSPTVWVPSFVTRLNFKNGAKWGLSASAQLLAESGEIAAERDASKSRQAAAAERSFSRRVTAEEVGKIRKLEAHLMALRARANNRSGTE